MYTYEMIGCADDNTRTYESEYGTYNKKDRFILSSYAESLPKADLINKLMHEDCWILQKKIPKRMTLKELEDALGYPVEIKEEKGEEDNTITLEYNPILDFIFNGRR